MKSSMMMHLDKIKAHIIVILIFSFTLVSPLQSQERIFQLKISQSQLKKVGLQIWKNECGGKIEGLTTWNKGEDFASMGIGHFIWFPEGYQGPFQETFSLVLHFIERQGRTAPEWLKNSTFCPWQSRDEFLIHYESPQMNELRQFLANTVELQLSFMVERLDNAFPDIIKGLSERKKKEIRLIFDRLLKTPQGVYVLVDYLNFKGDGTSLKERYQGKGWGLLQVLEKISLESVPKMTSSSFIERFVQEAKQLLKERVDNATPERNEKRWLQGWYNRLDTYLIYDTSSGTTSS